MRIPNPIPEGPHYAYVFKVKDRPEFKVGFSSNPTKRRSSLSRRSARLIEYKIWEFEHYFAALHIEQLLISYLKRFGLTSLQDWHDWFHIDEPAMAAAVSVVDELAQRITGWEEANWQLSCLPVKGTPYREHLERVVWPEEKRQAAARRKLKQQQRDALHEVFSALFSRRS